MDVDWISLAKDGESFEVTNSDARVRYEGTVPEHGDVDLIITHNADGIVYDLYDAESGEVLKSGWMEISDVLEFIGALGEAEVDLTRSLDQ